MPKGGETSGQAAPGDGSRRVVLAALAGNLAIAVTKFGAFAFTGSAAILTEGIHSLVDTGDQLLMLVGQRRAERPASPSHPFGYGQETYFWSFVVALMIFLAGGVVAVWEGVEKILQPAPLNRPGVSFAVLGASAIFEGLSFRTAYREYRRIVHGRDVRLFRFLRASKDPNVFATLLEDGAALAGLAIAALGIAGATFLGLAWADGAASVLIGLLLISVAAFMANETRSLIAGEAAAAPIEEAVHAAVARSGTAAQVAGIRTLHLGPRNILVAVRLQNPPPDRLAEVEAGVRAADPRIAEVLFEFGAGLSPAPPPGSSADGTAPPDPPVPPPAPPG
jgi:cation diffusion facilitator family transporter